MTTGRINQVSRLCFALFFTRGKGDTGLKPIAFFNKQPAGPGTSVEIYKLTFSSASEKHRLHWGSQSTHNFAHPSFYKRSANELSSHGQRSPPRNNNKVDR